MKDQNDGAEPAYILHMVSKLVGQNLPSLAISGRKIENFHLHSSPDVPLQHNQTFKIVKWF